jgi:uncharacterized protein YcfJ
MKKGLAIMLAMAMGIMTVSCASTDYNTQKGAAIGAGLGAIAGQVIGRNTAGTLIGLAGGALAGAIAGNAMDQDTANRRMDAAQQRQGAAYTNPAPQGGAVESPPGEWITVPGQWVGGKWIPSHRAWVPVNP